MPRPKKEGAPEPKKRSRNGCWPCKTRKVKCDEGKPACLNCQRLSETCDYSIRLNWEGRGKKKPEDEGQVDFSAGMITLTPTQVHTPDSATLSVSGDTGFQTKIWKPKNNSQLLGNQPSPIKFTPPHSTTALVEPALSKPGLPPTPISQDSLYSDSPNYSEYQYGQNYESNRSITPNRVSASSGVARPPEIVGQHDGLVTETQSNMERTNSGTALAHGTILPPPTDTRASTPSYYNSIRDQSEMIGPELPPIDRPSKRLRSDIDPNNTHFNMAMPPPNLASGLYSSKESQGSAVTISAPPTSADPPTPVSSHGDDGYRTYATKGSPYAIHDPPGLRRLSVNSLLSGPPGMPYEDVPSMSESNHDDVDTHSWPSNAIDYYQTSTTWGVDRGFKDLDIGKNDDANAISGASPTAMRSSLDLIINEDGELTPVEFGFGMQTNNITAFEGGGYYDKPVPISIPRSLEPLPAKLLENPMNLLYFHHFLNHTAGCLVPHNCLSNPFKTILPQMAVQDENLLNLLLAYSAFHRARLLRQPEPATRIAHWVKDIFPNLRHALNDPNKIISNANLATAIMLASLEIISPKAFGIAVPWQIHLDTARQMIEARGGPQTLQNESHDKVSSFLWSWFAYLDVLASLSGDRSRSLLSAWDLDYEIENDYSIDCILGFTSRCVNILAKIAELGRMCDLERIGPDNAINPDWKPSDDIITRAEKLEAELHKSRLHPARPCPHMQSTGEAAYHWDSLEMTATNEAFHWAGLVHLHRRVLGKQSSHSDVQTAVREIFGALYKVRKGSSAEACLLFPMFTAGCDAQDERQRSDILERLKGVESLGMTQVHAARTLMEKVFETGKPWETLVAGEFVG